MTARLGADKVSVNSGAIRNPDLISQAARLYGNQCVVISCDIKRVDGVFHVFAKGGREDTGMEAISWIKRCVEMGAGEVVVNSIDTDGVKQGFDIEMLKAVCEQRDQMMKVVYNLVDAFWSAHHNYAFKSDDEIHGISPFQY